MKLIQTLLKPILMHLKFFKTHYTRLKLIHMFLKHSASVATHLVAIRTC